MSARARISEMLQSETLDHPSPVRKELSTSYIKDRPETQVFAVIITWGANGTVRTREQFTDMNEAITAYNRIRLKDLVG